MMNRFLIFLFLGSNFMMAQVAQPPVKEAFKSIDLLKSQVLSTPNDLKDLFLYPIKNPKKTALFSGITLALVATDVPTTDFVQDHINPLFKRRIHTMDYLPTTAEAEFLFAGLVSLYGGSLIAKSEKGQVAAILSTKAMVYSYLYSHLVLKSIFGRSRPCPDLDNPEEGVYTSNRWKFGNVHKPYFDSRSEHTGFPSFHFTMFFAAAKTLQRVYDSYWIPYAVCAIGLLPHFKGHNHWVSDMVGGALIGTMIGNVIADNYFGIERESDNMSFLPIIGSDFQGLTFSMKF